ncbi:MAG: cytochrome P450 [Brevundimonas sp.]
MPAPPGCETQILPADPEVWTTPSFADAKAILACRQAVVVHAEEPNLNGPAPHLAAVARGGRMRTLWMWGAEEDRHLACRKAMAAAIGPKVLPGVAPDIEAQASALLDSSGQAPVFDLVDQYARPLIRDTLMGMIGIPPPHRTRLEASLQAMVGFIPGGQPGAAGYFALAAVATEIEDLWRHELPAGAVASRALLAAIETGELSRDEAISQATLLLFANSYTTLEALAGLLVRLSELPAVWQALRDGTVSVGQLVEEGLRLGPPSHLLLFRQATADIPCPAGPVPRNSRIVLPLGAVNRDPLVFADPDRFDSARTGPPHLAFGAGRHACVGAHLARHILQTGLRVLAERLRDWPADTAVVAAPGPLGGMGVRSLTLPAQALSRR